MFKYLWLHNPKLSGLKQQWSFIIRWFLWVRVLRACWLSVSGSGVFYKVAIKCQWGAQSSEGLPVAGRSTAKWLTHVTPGNWILSIWVSPKGCLIVLITRDQGRSCNAFMTQLWIACTIPTTTSYWSHNSALFRMGDHSRAWVPGLLGPPGTHLITKPHLPNCNFIQNIHVLSWKYRARLAVLCWVGNIT